MGSFQGGRLWRDRGLDTKGRVAVRGRVGPAYGLEGVRFYMEAALVWTGRRFRVEGGVKASWMS